MWIIVSWSHFFLNLGIGTIHIFNAISITVFLTISTLKDLKKVRT